MTKTDEFRITLAQLNPTVGDVAGNAAKARAAREKATADGATVCQPPSETGTLVPGASVPHSR